MGRSERNKGKRGQSEALDVLTERGYAIAELSAGRACEDLYGMDPHGNAVAIEVKNTAATRWAATRTQARDQARRRGCSWLVMHRVPGHPYTFVVEGADMRPVVWRGAGNASRCSDPA